MPLIQTNDISGELTKLRNKGVMTYGLSSNAATDLFDLKPSFPALLVAGSESHGLPETLGVDVPLSIPMSGKTESLNVAVASALALYHFRFHYSSPNTSAEKTSIES